MKTKWKVLIILVVIVVFLCLVPFVFGKLLVKPRVTPIGSVWIENIVVDSDSFEVEVYSHESAWVLSDYTVEKKERKLIVTIFSLMPSGEFQSKWKGNIVSYKGNMSDIDSIVVQDTSRQIEIWNSKHGVVCED